MLIGQLKKTSTTTATITAVLKQDLITKQIKPKTTTVALIEQRPKTCCSPMGWLVVAVRERLFVVASVVTVVDDLVLMAVVAAVVE